MRSTPDSSTLQDCVISATLEELVPRFNEVGRRAEHDGSIIIEADLAMQQRLERELGQLWPGIDLLSEEMPEEKQRNLLGATHKPLWCIDPLDGTSNFAAGLPSFAVSVALIYNGGPVTSVIYDPVRDESFRADKGAGVWLNEQPLCPSKVELPLTKAIALVDFKRLKPELGSRLVYAPPYGSQRNFGCCSLEWAWTAAGRAHLYLHGGQKLWDYAAGVLILAEAGGHSCTLQGEPVFKTALKSRSVVASADLKLFKAWCDWLIDIGSEPDTNDFLG